MVVHQSSGHWNRTLFHALCHLYPQMFESSSSSSLSKVEPERPDIVHRLYKGTFGAVLIAQTAPAHMKVSERFAQREIRKEYISITAGDP